MTPLKILKNQNLNFKRKDSLTNSFHSSVFIDAIDEFNRIIKTFDDMEIPIGDLLGLRNYSGFLGEVFNYAVVKKSNGYIRKNQHQDGYPDLLVMDETGQNEWSKVQGRLTEKSPFSPFAGGGIEVKATCGDIQLSKWFSKNKIQRPPQIGGSRIDYMKKYTWKSHHRETNNLCALIWDFVDKEPTIVAIMYTDDLTEEDWGKLQKPKEGGGNTTSVSIIKQTGVEKLFQGLIAIIDNAEYEKKMKLKLSAIYAKKIRDEERMSAKKIRDEERMRIKLSKINAKKSRAEEKRLSK